MSFASLLVPIAGDLRCLDGFIHAKGHEYRCRITLPSNPPAGLVGLQGTRLECDIALARLLEGRQEALEARLQQSTSVSGFLVELEDIVERLTAAGATQHESPLPGLYSRLMKELEAVGWGRLRSIDESFLRLNIASIDSKSREHLLVVSLPVDYPASAPQVQAELPIPWSIQWSADCGSIASVVQQFDLLLASLQPFWDAMDHLDQAMYVVEPLQPSRAATKRRVALGRQASLELEVNPACPSAPPEFRFVGAQHVIGIMHERLTAHVGEWDPQTDIRANICKALQYELPQRAASSESWEQLECGICYAFQPPDGSEGAPDQLCDGENCGQPFHQQCLVEWLRGLQGTRQTFDSLFGECPYCSSSISVRSRRL